MYPIRAVETFQFDIERVLVPIAPDSPGGESLRYEGTYDEIRTARAEDDPGLSQGVWAAPLKRADWPKVEALCLGALENRSKDLQIAAWLAEAWLHLYGFGGLREGLRVQAALCNAFWDTLHPESDSDDPEYRFAPFIWMNEKLPVPVKLLTVTAPESDDVKPYCWAEWEVAFRPQGPVVGKVTQAAFQQSVLLTPSGFFQNLFSEVDACVEACTILDSILESRCGRDAPSILQFTNTLLSIREFVIAVLKQREVPDARTNGESESNPLEGAPMQPPTEPGSPLEFNYAVGAIRSRAEAYRRLAEAADYLARTEPHSPTPYLARRAIKWGGMQLTDLLPELVRNSGELTEIYRLLQNKG